MVKSQTVTVNVGKFPTRIVDFSVSPTTVAPGQNIEITGRLQYQKDVYLWLDLDAKDVNLYADGVLVATDRTHPISGRLESGWFEFSHYFLDPGQHEIYVEFPGDDQFEGCEEELGKDEVGVGVFEW